MRLSILIWVGWSLFSTAMAIETLSLTERSGDIMEGSIVSYNPATGVVKLKIKNAYQLLSFEEFIDGSQQKITHWLSDRKFKSSTGLRVNIERDVKKSSSKKNQYDSETEKITYTISIENRASVPIDNIEIEYSVFYEQELPGQNLKSQKYRQVGTFTLPAIQPKGKKVYTTKMVTLEMRRLARRGNTYYYYENGADKESSGRLRGIAVELRKKSLSGKMLRREKEDGRVPDEDDWGKYKKVY